MIQGKVLEQQDIAFIDSSLAKKFPYSPPVLLKLETDEIAGGTANLQEMDGSGFVSAS